MNDEFVLFTMSWIDEATDSTDSPSNVDLPPIEVGFCGRLSTGARPGSSQNVLVTTNSITESYGQSPGVNEIQRLAYLVAMDLDHNRPTSRAGAFAFRYAAVPTTMVSEFPRDPETNWIPLLSAASPVSV